MNASGFKVSFVMFLAALCVVSDVSFFSDF